MKNSRWLAVIAALIIVAPSLAPSLVPLLALGMAGGLWLRGQMQQALWGGFDQALQEKAQRVAARLQLGPRTDLQEAPGTADEFSAITAE